jgi:hypothetical protein
MQREKEMWEKSMPSAPITGGTEKAAKNEESVSGKNDIIMCMSDCRWGLDLLATLTDDS